MMTNPVLEAFREQFFALLEPAERIVITSHMSPDDDSIGSVLTMYAVLTAKYPSKEIRMMYSGEPLDRWNTFRNFDRIEWVSDITDVLTDNELLVMLDASRHYLFSKFPEKLQAFPMRIAIDHHSSEPDAFTLLHVDAQYSSNAELVFRLFVEGGEYSKDIAESTLLGILGDTGSFAFVKPTQAEVFTLAKQLVEAVGESVDAFRSRYMGIPLKIIPLLQSLVHNAIYTEVAGWPPVQYTYIDRTILSKGSYTDEDISAASHIYIGQYLTKVKGYSWGFIVTPRTDGTCRISSRSLPGSVNVRVLHETLGYGGGHDRASGGKIAEGDPHEAAKALLAWMQEHQPQLG